MGLVLKRAGHATFHQGEKWIHMRYRQVPPVLASLTLSTLMIGVR